jgi:hypothetical protein
VVETLQRELLGRTVSRDAGFAMAEFLRARGGVRSVERR